MTFVRNTSALVASGKTLVTLLGGGESHAAALWQRDETLRASADDEDVVQPEERNARSMIR